MIKSEFERQKEKGKIVLIALLLVGCGLLTIYFHQRLNTHVMVTHLYYIPIVLASFWWGRKGVSVSVLLSVFLLTHFLFSNDCTVHVPFLVDYLRTAMFIVIGVVVSLLSEKLAKNTKELILSEQKYRTMLEQSNDMIWTLDTDGNFIFFNKRSEELVGIRFEDWKGKSFVSLVLEEDLPNVLNAFRETLKGTPQQYEARVKKEGENFLILSVNTALLKRADNIIGTVSFGRDITEHRKAEESLLNTHNYLDNLFNYASAPIIVWDPETRITRFNHAFEYLTGRTADEVIGQELHMLFPESSKDESLHKISSTLGGEYWKSEEIPILCKDGDVRTVLWNSANIYAEDGVTVIATIAQGMDITERQRVQENLLKSEEFNKRIIENSNDCIKILDLEGRLEFMSAGGQKLLEIEDIGPYLNKSWTDLWKGPDHKAALDAISTAKDGRKGQFQGFCPTEKGMEKWWDIIINPICDEYGKVKQLLAISRDITSQRSIEAQLQQAQKMESIGTLAGGIAHDFNNILFPIVGYTEMLLEDVPEDSPFRNSLKAIYTSALRAKSLVKQILTFSRQGSGELMLMKMQPIVKEALKLIRSTIPTTIEIKQDINPDCGVIKADPTQIHQIIMNLTTNAYHAMEETGGELKVSLKEVELGEYDIITPDMTPGAYVCLTVADTGVGMDKSLTDKIFGPFFTTKAIGKGTGMGLSVVHGIVNAIGGAIHVYSEPGKGTQFHVYLPVEKSSPEEQVSHSTTEIQGGTEQILLVDDEEAILAMEKQMLERLGYQVTPRTSSLEALEAFRTNPNKFDLIITDMAMPNMPGDKLSVELTKIRPDIPILLCTGFSETMSEEKATSLGIKGFILKPIVMKDLAQKIREVLDEN